MSGGDWLWIMDQTQMAVEAFAKAEIGSLGRQAMRRLKDARPSGGCGDQNFESAWDEYCFRVVNGLPDPLTTFCSDVIRDSVEALPRETAVLLSILAVGPLPENVGADIIGSVWKAGIARLISNELADLATNRKAKLRLQ